MNKWGEIPGNCSDFNTVLDSNVKKLQQIQVMIHAYAQAQMEHSITLQGRIGIQMSSSL